MTISRTRGEGLHRRSLYTFRKRTAPPPSMLTLDAGSREICQAAAAHDQHAAAAAHLPERSELLRMRARCWPSARVNGAARRRDGAAFLLLTSRSAGSAGTGGAAGAPRASRFQHYASDPPAAKAVCGEEDPALAALTIVCSTLLTADAALTNR